MVVALSKNDDFTSGHFLAIGGHFSFLTEGRILDAVLKFASNASHV